MITKKTFIFQDNHVFINFILPFKSIEEKHAIRIMQ